MKGEIKEILDKLQNYENYKFRSENGRRYKEIEAWEIELLLDYITNLQEELKSANESISWWQNRFNAVEKENERYKKIFEGKERFSKIMPNDTDFIILSKADYDRQQEDIELGLIDYKTRNEEAIEYITSYESISTIQGLDKIEQNKTLDEKTIIVMVNRYLEVHDKLLNILQGGDEK